MTNRDKLYETYVAILEEELSPAFGCTEPIALAYCAAKARETLGTLPNRFIVEASGNIIKNVKSVIVPNTSGMKGISAAAAAGMIAGNPDKALEVIAEVTEEEKRKIADYLKEVSFEVRPMGENCDKLDIRVTVFSGEHSASVRISKYHTNIVLIEKDGQVLLGGDYLDQTSGESVEENIKKDASGTLAPAQEGGSKADRSLLCVADILKFADEIDLSLVRDLIRRQIEFNYEIAQEGIRSNWGANVGSVLLRQYGNDIKIRAKAMAAAASDARMSGCELPVVINSGSGNQGITVSVPVIEYAKELGASEDKLYRALLVSNLIAIHLKAGMGTLSAYCGAVSAGCAAGCGVAYLKGGGLDEISHTLVNSIAIVSGIVCDGAKPSCAAKIAASVDAGIFGYEMFMEGQQFYAEDGLVSGCVESTIQNICRLGAKGMCETDEEIIRIMTHR